MTVSLLSDDFNNRIKNKTPVCNNIQGFVLYIPPLKRSEGAITSCRPYRRRPLAGHRQMLPQDRQPIHTLLLTT